MIAVVFCDIMIFKKILKKKETNWLLYDWSMKTIKKVQFLSAKKWKFDSVSVIWKITLKKKWWQMGWSKKLLKQKIFSEAF